MKVKIRIEFDLDTTMYGDPAAVPSEKEIKSLVAAMMEGVADWPFEKCESEMAQYIHIDNQSEAVIPT